MEESEKTNFLLQHMLPVYFINEQNVMATMKSQFFDRAGRFSYPSEDTYRTEHGTLVTPRHSMVAGSGAEGLAVPDHFLRGGTVPVSCDRDQMAYTDKWRVENPSEECTKQGLQQGTMVQVEPLGGDSGANYANVKMTPEFRALCNLIGWKPRYDCLAHDATVNHSMEGCTKYFVELDVEAGKRTREINRCGPCATFQINPGGEPYTYNRDIDLCWCLGLDGWPQAAESWPTRTRRSGWPSERLIQEVTQKGFHMVPTPRRNVENAEFEWRYSFSVAEKTRCPVARHQFSEKY